MPELLKLLRPEFTDWDREACKPLIARIVELGELCRKEGLPGLIDEAEGEEFYFLKKGLLLVIGGAETEVISSILHKLILTGRYTGVELLKRLIAAEGVMEIQKSTLPNHLEERLTALLGERYLAQLDADRLREKESQKIRTKEQFLERKKERESSGEIGELDSLLCRLEDEQVDRFLRNVQDDELGIVLKGCTYDTAEKILRNTAETRHDAIFAASESPIRICDLEEVQKKLLALLYALADAGEISL